MSKKDSEQVTLAHGAFVDGKFVAPGTKVTVSKDDARALHAGGYVVTDEPVGVIESGADSA